MKYDPETALDLATELFWQKGYKGTTMRDLQSTLDMRPGSIYSGLGNKESLYKRALQRYTEQSLEALQVQVSKQASPVLALKAFIENEFLVLDKNRAPRMCFAVKTLNEQEEGTPICKLATEGLRQMRNAFAEQFERARQLGEIASDENCQKLAQWLQVQIAGLLCLARLEQDESTLRSMVNNIFQRIVI